MKEKKKTDEPPADDEFRVDPEFAALIPPLSKEEVQRLEISLLAEGCRDPLIVWKGENILLDGHNRLALCRKHNIPFSLIFVELSDRAAAQAYIISLQLARRNLSREAAAYLRGKRYAAEKKPLGGARASEEGVDQNDPLTTAQRLAEEYKVGEATIKRDEQFAKAIDAIVENCGKESKDLILSRDTGLSRIQVLNLAKENPRDQKRLLQLSKEGGRPLRRKGKTRQTATIRLPTEPKSLANALIDRLSEEGVAEVAKILNELLHKKASKGK